MQFTKEADQYILQCKLIALDGDKCESKEPVTVQSEIEAQQHLAQERSVILNGLVMSTLKDQAHIVKPGTIEQNLRLNSSDVEKVYGAMRIMQRYIDHGELDRMMQLLQKDAECQETIMFDRFCT